MGDNTPQFDMAYKWLSEKIDDRFWDINTALELSALLQREQARAVAEARPFLDREKLANAIWDIDVENQREDDELHGHAQTEYAKWPADSSTQPYCQWAYRMADKLLERQLAEVKEVKNG